MLYIIYYTNTNKYNWWHASAFWLPEILCRK